MNHCELGKPLFIIPFINVTYAHNPGAAFSFLADKSGWQCWLLSALAVVITVILLGMIYHSNDKNNLLNAAYAMIIGGALGNLFDRMVYGVVIDFIDFYVSHWHWPTFNIADGSIFIGAILIILDNFVVQPRKNVLSRKDTI